MTPKLFACNWPRGEKRAPNRKPRWRKRMAQDTLSAKKDSFLAHVRAGAKRGEAAEKAHLVESTARNLVAEDSDFKAQVLEAEAEAVAEATGTLVGALPLAAETFKAGLTSKKEGVRLDTAHKFLRGRGLFSDKQETDLNVKALQIIKIVREDD